MRTTFRVVSLLAFSATWVYVGVGHLIRGRQELVRKRHDLGRYLPMSVVDLDHEVFRGHAIMFV